MQRAQTNRPVDDVLRGLERRRSSIDGVERGAAIHKIRHACRRSPDADIARTGKRAGTIVG
jgi:hypothetical protein